MSTTQNVIMKNSGGTSLYPYTTVENVVGLQSALANKANASDVRYVVSELDVVLTGTATKSELFTHTDNTEVHVTADEKAAWDNNANQVQMIDGSSLDESTLETGKLYFAYE